MKVAVVGTGISGLVSAYLLAKEHELTVYEANSYIGGHTNTIDVPEKDRTLPIDTGFIVFNKKTYPHFLELLNKLKVAYQETSMSFSVKCETSGLEYNGTNINKLFAQRMNIFKPKFLKMILGILKFNKEAKKYLQTPNTTDTLRDFVDKVHLSSEVVNYYLIPMASAVWSADPRQMFDFPAEFILRFWENHGFLEIDDRPQWYVIKGGSRAYISPLIASFKDQIRLSSPVTKITRQGAKCLVEVHGKDSEEFDRVIIATHSDQAIKLLADPSEEENSLLSSIPYQRNEAVLHTNINILPKSHRAWAAWNYHLVNNSTCATVTYNMNILQSLETKSTYNVTINPHQKIPEQDTIRCITYEHPVFTTKGMHARETYFKLKLKTHTFFAGAYLRNGFHEDGVVSAINAVRKLNESV